MTYVLIGVTLVVFVLQSTSADLQRQLVLWIPAIAYHGEPSRLVTSAFLHYGFTYLVFNSCALYVVGPQVERCLGRVRFIGLYVLSALGGSTLAYLLAPLDTATAGGSGAIFGLFGAVFVLVRRLDVDIRWVLGLITVNLAFTFIAPLIGSQFVTWRENVAGLVTGATLCWAYAHTPGNNRILVAAGVSLGVLLLFATLALWRTSDLQIGIS
ncbi:rhomboid family intramembrane serine protease [Mycobacterium sp. NPDC006124]|uniref:rhomboid family intramembrane serine protease n=1 Tax=Mycobacterium sp. NPDC006124 TaxID=3156729 RepID=UPI0033BB65D3